MKKGSLIIIFLNFCLLLSISQTTPICKEIILQIDSFSSKLTKDAIEIKNEKYIPFFYDDDSEVVSFEAVLNNISDYNSISILPSIDFSMVDSLINYNNESLKFKLRFHNITRSNFLSVRFKYAKDSLNTAIKEVKLFPYTKSQVSIYPNEDALFIGEEKSYDVISALPDNIKEVHDWTRSGDFNYRLLNQNGQLRLFLMPLVSGRKIFNVKFNTRKPFVDEKDRIIYDLPTIQYPFFVKAAKLAFLQIDQTNVVMDDQSRIKGVEVVIDNNINLQVQKTYRIEAQEASGGMLIAEIFTRNDLANNKMLCWLRVYNFHRQTSGYLYIKDGDVSRFITNFNIIPQTRIDKIMILRDGTGWVDNNVVYPGESIILRIEGESLLRSQFSIDQIQTLNQDSANRTDGYIEYKLTIPYHISKKSLAINNYSYNTGKSLMVREFAKARPFDYLFIDYGNMNRTLSKINQPVKNDKTINNVVISYNSDLIDSKNSFYGKQYMDIEVRITGPRNELIELKNINNVCFCPSESSPRFPYYDKSDCQKGDLSLNDYLSRKTYELEGWSKISVTFAQDKNVYGREAQTKTVEIYAQKRMKFDIEVSFPAGLITRINETKKDTSYWGSLGISMAMMAQFSFYNPNKINSLQPYKIGAGFLALNAFNFNQNVSNRDLGIVVIGMLNPIRRDSKLAFPLYVGGGYLLNQGAWFWLLGPGVSVRF